MRLAFFLNLIFAIVELVGGIWVGSLAILSDAVHDFGDALALGAALYFEKKSLAPSSGEYTYGLRRLSALSAVLMGVILLMGSLWILKESIEAWGGDHHPSSLGMLGLAALGVAVNGYAAWKVSRGQSLNERMIHWHLIEDVLGWLVVLVGALFIQIFDWPQVDLILAGALSIWMIYNVFKNLKPSLQVFLQGIPEGLNVERLETSMQNFPEVENVHHTHLWTLDGHQHIVTSHVRVKPETTPPQAEALKNKIKTELQKLGVVEATLELEWDKDNCRDPKHGVV